jgi:hypothetical protein
LEPRDRVAVLFALTAVEILPVFVPIHVEPIGRIARTIHATTERTCAMPLRSDFPQRVASALDHFDQVARCGDIGHVHAPASIQRQRSAGRPPFVPGAGFAWTYSTIGGVAAAASRSFALAFGFAMPSAFAIVSVSKVSSPVSRHRLRSASRTALLHSSGS